MEDATARTQLIIQRVGSNNSYIVKRKNGGGVQFSRDPLNLMNKHSRKVGAAVRSVLGFR